MNKIEKNIVGEPDIAAVFLILTIVGSISFGFAMGGPAWGIAAFCAVLLILFVVRL